MQNKQIVLNAREALLKAGAEKAQCMLVKQEKHELNVDTGEISLLRTTFDTNLYLTGITDNKKGSVTINNLDKEAIDNAVQEVMELANSSQPDTANDISEKQPAREFNTGPESADLDKMYDRLIEFMDYAKKAYPNTNIRQVHFSFTRSNAWFVNSNEVDFTSDRGSYTFVVVFSTKEGKKISSFNYTAYVSKDLEKPFYECGSIDRLLRQSSEQLDTKSVPEKFVGNVIVTPECMDEIIGSVTRYLYDYSLITGTSVYKDKMNEAIADNRLTLHSRPVSDDFATGYHVTGDGYETQNSTIIDKGMLKTFLLGLYGSRKTGLPKAVNSGGCYVIEPGNTSYDEIIKSTKQGILLCRFSGGNPSDNGDFSGVAKNSYYIEDGEIKYPISETMVTGNLVEMLKNIEQISAERINSGYHNYPWIKFDGLTVSGK